MKPEPDTDISKQPGQPAKTGPAVAQEDAPPPKTRGEQLFNALSWALFGWIANAAVSIKMADVLENRFRPAFIKGGKTIAESSFFKPFFKDKPQEGLSLARSLFSVVALLPGGYTVLLPIKFMEDRKLALVKTFDRWLGPSNPDEATQKQIEARYEQIEQAPKLSWGDMLKGRTLPVLGIVATHFAFASNKTNIVNIAAGKEVFGGLNKRVEQTGNFLYRHTKESGSQTIRNATNAIEQRLDAGLQKRIKALGPENEQYFKTNGKMRSGNDRLRGYLNNTSIDLLYSALVAGATFVIGHLSAFKREEKQEVKRTGQPIPAGEKRKFQLDSTAAEEATATDRPKATLQNVQYENRLADSPALQHGA